MRVRLTVAGVAALLLASSLSPAYAGNGRGGGGTGEPPASGGTEQAGESGDGGHIGSRVKVVRSNPGGGTPVAPAQANWSPPACWYEPKFTPEEFQKYWRDSMIGWSTGKKYVMPKNDELEKAEFNKGEDGLWWQRVFNEDMPPGEALDGCASEGWPEIWVETGDPAPPEDAITPEMLSELAYQATRLPAPPVELSPAADNQKVNLETYASFDQPLDRVWVTASLDFRGVDIAATTVATPVALEIDAGTEHADPQSCSYDLTRPGGGDGYAVDTEDADCNITYRRTSGNGSYPLRARITWEVTWTDSADPDGPPREPGLPDGRSTYEQDVTVEEVQAVNR